MEGSVARPTTQDRQGVPVRAIWRDLGLLALLLVISAVGRFWLIRHTEVAARDSIGFIRYAVQLEEKALIPVLRENLQHPGYPAIILAVSLPVRQFCGGVDAASMQLSAQLASGLAGLLLVVPLFYLGVEMFDRRTAFWGAAVFQCLPVSSQVMSDGLSEATYLLFTTTALWLAVRGFRTRSILSFAVSGASSGLAYLVRPEGLLVLPAAGLVLLGMQAVRAWRWPWRRVLACGTCLVLAASLTGGPYAAIIGRLTNKPTARTLIETPPAAAQGPVAEAPLAVIFADWLTDHQRGSLGWGLEVLTAMLVKGYYYILWLPTLLGLWRYRGRFTEGPGLWVLLLATLLLMAVLVRMVMLVGYLSERHVLLLVLLGINWGVRWLLGFGDWLAALGPRFATTRGWLAPGSRLPGRVVLAGLMIAGLAGALKPLHASRAGHHAAGRWLAAHLTPHDRLIDPFAWAHYYAGRVFLEESGWVQPAEARVQYVVLDGRTNPVPQSRKVRDLVQGMFAGGTPERIENDHPRLPLMQEARDVAQRGRVVYHWPEHVSADRAKVLIFATETR
jgi:hypothetical protein